MQGWVRVMRDVICVHLLQIWTVLARSEQYPDFGAAPSLPLLKARQTLLLKHTPIHIYSKRQLYLVASTLNTKYIESRVHCI